MSAFENHAGLTITPSKLQLVEIIYSGEQFLLHNVDEVYFNEPINLEYDRETKIISLIQSAYNELLIRKQLKSKNISFTLPLSLFHVMQIPYDNTLLTQDLVEEFRWEFSLLYPYLHTKDLVIQYLEIERNPFNDNGTAIVISLNRKYLQLLHSFCEQNKVKLKFVDNAHIASDRALFLNNSLNDKGITLSVYFSNNYLSIIFSLNTKPVYFKIIQLKDAGELIPVLIDELTKNAQLNISGRTINSAFLSGDEISPSLTEQINKSTGVDFKYFNPFGKITPDRSILNSIHFTDKFNSFAPAAGIAYRLS